MGARTGRTTSTAYAKLAAPGAPCAGNGVRGFYATTPCLLRAGFLTCENRHLKKTWGRKEWRAQDAKGPRAGQGRPR